MKRNKFSLSHTRTLSMEMGTLVPIGCYEVLPGDTVQQATSALVRCAPLNLPVMHPTEIRIHHWFVPNRLVWEDWEDFITGGPDGLDASVFPTITAANNASWAAGALLDNLGYPSWQTNMTSYTASALPVRAYQLIFNEWYRDQQILPEVTIDLGSGPDTTTILTMQSCGWGKDYFTTVRPDPQLGAEVTIPLATEAPVLGIGSSQTFGLSNISTYDSAQTNPTYAFAKDISASTTYLKGTAASGGYPDISADLSSASGTIRELRTALALQRYEEARNRYGSRYTEYLRYLGVKSSDARLQRPEYLGGGKQMLQFSEVLTNSLDATSGSSDAGGAGQMFGHGIGAMRSNRYRRFFEEHGFVISLMSVRPKNMYSDLSPRMFNRRTKEDYWQKELEHVGMQEVYQNEICPNDASRGNVFGYQDRYSEYRHIPSTVHGVVKTTQDEWTMARIFAAPPALNSTFIQCNPADRIYQNVGAFAQDLICNVNHSIQARRIISRGASGFAF